MALRPLDQDQDALILSFRNFWGWGSVLLKILILVELRSIVFYRAYVWYWNVVWVVDDGC